MRACLLPPSLPFLWDSGPWDCLGDHLLRRRDTAPCCCCSLAAAAPACLPPPHSLCLQEEYRLQEGCLLPVPRAFALTPLHSRTCTASLWEGPLPYAQQHTCSASACTWATCALTSATSYRRRSRLIACDAHLPACCLLQEGLLTCHKCCHHLHLTCRTNTMGEMPEGPATPLGGSPGFLHLLPPLPPVIPPHCHPATTTSFCCGTEEGHHHTHYLPAGGGCTWDEGLSATIGYCLYNTCY